MNPDIKNQLPCENNSVSLLCSHRFYQPNEIRKRRQQNKFQINICLIRGNLIFRELCWRSGESTGLPPMRPGVDSRIRSHMWVEFVDSLLCSERFSPLTKNQHLIWIDLCWFDFLSPQLVEPLCSAKYTWDIIKWYYSLVLLLLWAVRKSNRM